MIDGWTVIAELSCKFEWNSTITDVYISWSIQKGTIALNTISKDHNSY